MSLFSPFLSGQGKNPALLFSLHSPTAACRAFRDCSFPSTALSQLPGLPEEIVFQVVQFIMSAVTCRSLSLIPSPVSGKGLFIKSGGSVV